jgi:hypothetical protein
MSETRMIERGVLRTEGTRDAACEASEIGLAPGEWPMVLRVPDRFGRLLDFDRLRTVRDREGDVLWTAYTYRERHSTITLRVYND